MDSFLIQGGTPLRGTVDVSGAKNAALPVLAACLMGRGESTLHAVPRLSDIDAMLDLMRVLGCRVERSENASKPAHGGPALNGPLSIEVTDESKVEAGYDIVSKMRASICVLGPLLGARGRAIVSLPGGCAIGDRPVDLHLRGLRKLGADFDLKDGNIVATVKGRLKGARMYLGGANGPTVLGTINVMSAAAMAEGETVIVGAACEPEVADVANLLNKMGARITGYGTPEIKIDGVDKLTAAEHKIIPDRIEAATFIIAAAITGGDLTLTNCDLHHLLAVVDQLESIGVKLEERADGGVRVTRPGTLSPVEFTTQPYPGFPTDVQAQFVALLSIAGGMSVIGERIFPERFQHLSELNRLGAHVRKEGSTAFIHGVEQLQGATVMASDLRASAALVLAGLVAKGTTRINRVYHIDRGYEKIEQKLGAVGARIERASEKK